MLYHCKILNFHFSSFPLQESVGIELQKVSAVYRSRIAGADTTAVPQIDEDRNGAPSLRTLTGTNCGGTAGEEVNVRGLVVF